MLGLPKSTEYGKRVPKQTFYEKLNVTPALKRQFVENIKTIIWRNKIATTTMNLAAGKDVTEIEVFEVRLSGPELDDAVLRQIDRRIPYHILFILEYDKQYQAWIGFKEATAYKEASADAAAFKVNRYYHTAWMAEDELPIKVDGLNMDAVYENFVRQLAGDDLQPSENEESLHETVQRNEQRAKLEKQIEALEKKVRRERQLNKQMELNSELKEIKYKLSCLNK